MSTPKKTFDEALDEAFNNIVEDKVDAVTQVFLRLEHTAWAKTLRKFSHQISHQNLNGPPVNFENPVLVVVHSALGRSSEDSPYRSDCPVCGKGVLLVRRDPTTSLLCAEDNCLLCGQRVVYEDIEDMRDRLG